MIVQLTRDWKQYEEGDTLTEEDRPLYTLRFLVSRGWAVDITYDQLELPTMSNLKDEIKAYLDAKDIPYENGMTKKELLELI